MYDQVVQGQRAGLCLSEHFLIYYAASSVGLEHGALMTIVCLSVCLSVPYLTLSREWKGLAS